MGVTNKDTFHAKRIQNHKCGIGYSHELLWKRGSGDSDVARKPARQFIVDCSDESMNVAVPTKRRSEPTDSLLSGKDERSCRMLFPAPQ